MKKYTKLFTFFILFLFCFLSANRSYAQNAYVLLELESYQYPKVQLHLYHQDSVLIDSFFVVIDTTFVLKLPINDAYYLKIILPNYATDYKDMDKIIPLDFTKTKPYTVQKHTINLRYSECYGYYSWDNINFPKNGIDILPIARHIEIFETLTRYLKNYPCNNIKLIGHTDHLEKINKVFLSNVQRQ
jgi:hypothetical protein